jgi:hypothetical protein
MNLANNTRFCPTRATVGALNIGTVEALTSQYAANITCRREDFSQTTLKEYLASPATYLTAIPPPPPSKARPAGSGGGKRSSSKGGKLPGGAVAGIVIGVFAAVGGLAALAYFVGRPMYQERKATGFFKTRELDLPLPGQPNGATAAAVMESGWNRTI